jgi:hypothetical protein
MAFVVRANEGHLQGGLSYLLCSVVGMQLQLHRQASIGTHVEAKFYQVAYFCMPLNEIDSEEIQGAGYLSSAMCRVDHLQGPGCCCGYNHIRTYLGALSFGTSYLLRVG